MVGGKEYEVEARFGDWLSELEVYVDGVHAEDCRKIWACWGRDGQVEEIEANEGLVDRAFECNTEFTVDGRRAVVSSSGIFSYRHQLSVDDDLVTGKEGVGQATECSRPFIRPGPH